MLRGDLALAARQILRPEGTLGLVAAVAGGTALSAAYLPWYEVTATVDLLGATSSRSVSGLAGWQAHPWGWLVPAIALVMIGLGLLLAIDRTASRSSEALILGGMGLALAATVAGRWFPPVSKFDVAGTRLRDMVDLAGRLPRDVNLVFAVKPGVGLWLTLVSAALLLACGLTARAIR
jgi:hypothetical protein